jgi:hypothetical protein
LFSKTHTLPLLLIAVILLIQAISACSPQNQSAILNMLPMNKMPAEVQSAPAMVQSAYQFASANPGVMKHIPCYVSNVDAQGSITFDNHALGCFLCVNITQDTMRLLKEGKTVPEIKAYVEATYGKYGTSNIP